MKTVPVSLVCLAILLAVMLNGCRFSTANIAEVALAASINDDKSPRERVTEFHKHHSMLHCCARLANIPSGTMVKAIWYQHSEADKLVIDSTEIEIESDAWIDFSLSPAGTGFPYGDYSVDLYLDGKFNQTIPFTIKPQFNEGPIREAVMAERVSADYFPTTLHDVFPTSVGTYYASVYVDNAPAGTTISAVWYHMDDSAGRMDIATQDYPCEGSGWIGFSLKPNNSLRAGRYFVDILNNGVVHNSMAYTLE